MNAILASIALSIHLSGYISQGPSLSFLPEQSCGGNFVSSADSSFKAKGAKWCEISRCPTSLAEEEQWKVLFSIWSMNPQAHLSKLTQVNVRSGKTIRLNESKEDIGYSKRHS
jgi:hypothetical protein